MKIRLPKKWVEYNDSGFGSKPENEPTRLINQDGSVNVRKTGVGILQQFSIFHFLVTIKWRWFNLYVVLSFLTINAFFASLYYLIEPASIASSNIDGFDSFMDAFYFSAQTFSTVGYGRLNPLSNAGNIISVLEMLIGMMYLALATGLLYARFSRPVSKVLFSDKALIAPYLDRTGLMFRISNAKNNLLINVEVRVLLTMKLEVNGKIERKFFILPLERNRIDLLSLSWTVVHPIDDDSPLNGLTEKIFNESDPEIVVLVNGFNDTLSQSIHHRTSYKYPEVEWDAKFDYIFSTKKGKTIIDLSRISSFSKV